MATAEELKDKQRSLQAMMDEVQRQVKAQEDAELAAQGQPLEDAIQRATTAEALVVQLQDSLVQLQARSEQLATENRALERKNIELRGKVEDLTAGVSGAVQIVLNGVAQSADALKQASNNMAILEANAKGHCKNLQSVVEAITRGIATKQDTSAARTSGTLR